MLGSLGWMGVLLVLLAAAGVVGYVLVVVECAEDERRAMAGDGRRARGAEEADAEMKRIREVYDRLKGRAA